jgi:hypothetical protein
MLYSWQVNRVPMCFQASALAIESHGTDRQQWEVFSQNQIFLFADKSCLNFSFTNVSSAFEFYSLMQLFMNDSQAISKESDFAVS